MGYLEMTLEKRWILSTNTWTANHFLSRIYQGRVPNYNEYLHVSECKANKKWNKLSGMRREELSIFKINFDPTKVLKLGEA